MPHGLLFDRGVIHGESTKGFTYTFGKKTPPGFPTDGPRVPHPSGPGEVRAWEHQAPVVQNLAMWVSILSLLVLIKFKF